MHERLFIAIPVHLENYADIIEAFSPLIQGRWRETTTLHVTLAFLGNRFRSEEIIRSLKHIDWSFEPSVLDRFDYFSGSRVFVALTSNPSLQKLRVSLETALGLEHQHLNPHVTLMRVKTITALESFQSRLSLSSPAPLGYLKPKIILYRSTLSSQGAYYESLFEWTPFSAAVTASQTIR